MIEQNDFSASLCDPGIHGVEGTFGRTDQQTQNQRGEGGEHSSPYLDCIFRVTLQKILPQHHLQSDSKDTVKVGAGMLATLTEDASGADETYSQRIHL